MLQKGKIDLKTFKSGSDMVEVEFGPFHNGAVRLMMNMQRNHAVEAKRRGWSCGENISRAERSDSEQKFTPRLSPAATWSGRRRAFSMEGQWPTFGTN
jgi:hypothetical protein